MTYFHNSKPSLVETETDEDITNTKGYLKNDDIHDCYCHICNVRLVKQFNKLLIEITTPRSL